MIHISVAQISKGLKYVLFWPEQLEHMNDAKSYTYDWS